MRKLKLFSMVLVALALSAPALAEDGFQVRVRMGFPVILPPLVEIQPGVRVVQDFDQEVFFTNGYYWTQRDGRWYRARDHRGTWSYFRSDRLPTGLTRAEPGYYRHWRHEEGRSWPDSRYAGRGTRHWRGSQYRVRPQQQETRSGPRGWHDGDRQGNDRRDGDRRGNDGRDGNRRGNDNDRR